MAIQLTPSAECSICGSTEVAYGNDPGTSPTLGLVRLSLTIATSTMAHVKLWVTGRDAS